MLVLLKEPGSLNFFPNVMTVVDRLDELVYFCVIGRWSQVVHSFDLFIEGFDSISSDPVPKIFKLTSCKEVIFSVH